MDDCHPTLRILLLGPPNVGKSSLIEQLQLRNPKEDFILITIDQVVVRIKFVTDLYLLLPDACLFVFDLSLPETLESLEEVYDVLVRCYNQPHPFILVGNKADISRVSNVPVARWCAKRNHMPYFETSTIHKTGLEDLLNKITDIAFNYQRDHDEELSKPISQKLNLFLYKLPDSVLTGLSLPLGYADKTRLSKPVLIHALLRDINRLGMGSLVRCLSPDTLKNLAGAFDVQSYTDDDTRVHRLLQASKILGIPNFFRTLPDPLFSRVTSEFLRMEHPGLQTLCKMTNEAILRGMETFLHLQNEETLQLTATNIGVVPEKDRKFIGQNYVRLILDHILQENFSNNSELRIEETVPTTEKGVVLEERTRREEVLKQMGYQDVVQSKNLIGVNQVDVDLWGIDLSDQGQLKPAITWYGEYMDNTKIEVMEVENNQKGKAEKKKENAEREANLEAERKAKEMAEKETKLKAEKEAKEKAQRDAKLKEEKEAKEKAQRDAKLKEEKEAKEKAQRDAKLKEEKEAKEKAQREAKRKEEKEAKEKAERDAKLKEEKEAKEKAEREAKLKVEKEAKEKAERDAKLKAEKERAEKEAKDKAEKEAKLKAEKEAKLKTEKEAKEKAEREAMLKAEMEAKEKAEREAMLKAEKEAKEMAEREAKLKAEKEAKEKAENEAKLKAEKEAKEKSEREAMQKKEKEAKKKAENEAKAKAEKEAKEKAEREAREKMEREAREKVEREAREKIEREAREKIEREAREKIEREAREKIEREAREKTEREAREKIERESREKAEKETREKEEKDKLEKEIKEKEIQEKRTKEEKNEREKKQATDSNDKYTFSNQTYTENSDNEEENHPTLAYKSGSDESDSEKKSSTKLGSRKRPSEDSSIQAPKIKKPKTGSKSPQEDDSPSPSKKRKRTNEQEKNDDSDSSSKKNKASRGRLSIKTTTTTTNRTTTSNSKTRTSKLSYKDIKVGVTRDELQTAIVKDLIRYLQAHKIKPTSRLKADVVKRTWALLEKQKAAAALKKIPEAESNETSSDESDSEEDDNTANLSKANFEKTKEDNSKKEENNHDKKDHDKDTITPSKQKSIHIKNSPFKVKDRSFSTPITTIQDSHNLSISKQTSPSLRKIVIKNSPIQTYSELTTKNYKAANNIEEIEKLSKAVREVLEGKRRPSYRQPNS